MYYNFKKVTLIYSTNKEIMEKIGRKLGFSHEKNQFVPIDTPLMSTDLAYGTGQMMFTTENGKSLCNNEKQYLCFWSVGLEEALKRDRKNKESYYSKKKRRVSDETF